MDYEPILQYLITLSPKVELALMILGSLVIIGMIVDKMIPDEKDGGFMSKILSIPLLGDLLKHLKRYSPLNIKEDEKKEE